MIVINFSGGRTSALMLWMIIQAHGGTLPDNYIVVFQNTGMERPETLDFVRDVGNNWGVDIVWLEYDLDKNNRPYAKVVDYESASRDGTPFIKLIIKRKRLPNATQRFCTVELKILTCKRYMVSLGHKKWLSAVGFRADEMGRVLKEKVNKKKDTRITPYYPLAEAGVVKKDIYVFWVKSNFDLKLENNNGTTPLGNCDGCFLKSEKTKAYICRTTPDRAAIWAGMEKLIGGLFRDQQSWQNLIDFVDKQGDFDFSDETDLYCESSLGSCTDW